jgi:hypothetical protein
MKLIDTREPYDPSWLVELAKEQYPKTPELAQELEKCIKILKPVTILDTDRDYYVYFKEDNEGSRGGNIILDVDGKHSAILDVFEDYRVIGLEFLNNLSLKNARVIEIDA